MKLVTQPQHARGDVVGLDTGKKVDADMRQRREDELRAKPASVFTSWGASDEPQDRAPVVAFTPLAFSEGQRLPGQIRRQSLDVENLDVRPVRRLQVADADAAARIALDHARAAGQQECRMAPRCARLPAHNPSDGVTA